MIKSYNKYIGIFLLIILLSGQVYYFTVVYPEYKKAAREVSKEIMAKENKLKKLEEDLKRLPSTKAALEEKKLEVTSLMGRMPSYTLANLNVLDIMSMLEESGFVNIQLEKGEVIEHVYEGQKIFEEKYSLSYISPFSESKYFVESLNHADQLINISSFTTHNTPQVDEKSKKAYQLLYGDQFKELVESTVSFALFINPEKEDELYDPAMNLLLNNKDVFSNLEVKEEFTYATITHKNNLEIPKRKEETVFNLQMKDFLNAGDNYRLIGPNGENGDIYLGLTSQEEIYISLTLRETGYTMDIGDAKGNFKEIEVDTPIESPFIFIESDRVKAENNLAKVYVKVDNQTEDIAVIEIEGVMEGQLHIYNAKEEEISRGGIRGNIIVK